MGQAPENPGLGWLVRRSVQPDTQSAVDLLSTVDGGDTWETAPLPLSPDEAASIAAATPEFLDAQTGWVALKLQSGSNFSQGRLFATQDGGRSWQERSLPLGEPVRFVDPLRGWVAGGPAGDQLFNTVDGGLTWSELSLPIPDSSGLESKFVGLPEFADRQSGFLPVTVVGEMGSSLVLFKTSDGGHAWVLDALLELDAANPPANSLPFALAEDQEWRAAVPNEPRLLSATTSQQAFTIQGSGLSGSVIALDFSADGSGWAVVQEGSCQGNKTPGSEESPPGDKPWHCEITVRLMATSDGGQAWTEVMLPEG
jgi:photosystem II stability/assembly factor-like uncharacterized protein